MNRLIAPLVGAFFVAIFACVPSHAQLMVRTVTSCGGLSLSPGVGSILFQDTTGALCSSASGGSFTWPGTAGLATGGTTSAGTMPYVNAYIVNGSSGGTSSNFGSAFPTAGTAIGLTNGTNMIAWSATTTYGTAPAAIAVPGVNADVTNVNSNGQATMANSSPVVIASNQSNLPANLAAEGGTAVTSTPTAYGTAPTGNVIGANVFVTNANANGQAIAANSSPVVLPAAQVTADPCSLGAKTNLAISTNATALTQIIAASGSTKIYICSITLIAPGATAFNLNTGTGTNCGTSTAALVGSTTAANGLSFAANGGLTLGNGSGTVAVTAASSELCTLQSNAVQIAGNLTYVQQ